MHSLHTYLSVAGLHGKEISFFQASTAENTEDEEDRLDTEDDEGAWSKRRSDDDGK